MAETDEAKIKIENENWSTELTPRLENPEAIDSSSISILNNSLPQESAVNNFTNLYVNPSRKTKFSGYEFYNHCKTETESSYQMMIQAAIMEEKIVTADMLNNKQINDFKINASTTICQNMKCLSYVDSSKTETRAPYDNLIDLFEDMETLKMPKRKSDCIPDGEDNKRIHSCQHWHRGIIALLYLFCNFMGVLQAMKNERIFVERLQAYQDLIRNHIIDRVKYFDYCGSRIYYLNLCRITFGLVERYCYQYPNHPCDTLKCLTCKLLKKPSDKTYRKRIMKDTVLFDGNDIFPSYAIHVLLTSDFNMTIDEYEHLLEVSSFFFCIICLLLKRIIIHRIQFFQIYSS